MYVCMYVCMYACIHVELARQNNRHRLASSLSPFHVMAPGTKATAQAFSLKLGRQWRHRGLGGTPSHHQFLKIFPLKTICFGGTPPFMETPPYWDIDIEL